MTDATPESDHVEPFDFKIVYTDGSTQILKALNAYTITNRWIEFHDALGQLQSVRADDVRRISRSSVEDLTDPQPVLRHEVVGVDLNHALGKGKANAPFHPGH